ncbi:MAG: TIGR02452 family protein [Eubacterium sp.]|nr:TIGR02452 family protein [Eubacterium sp.]
MATIEEELVASFHDTVKAFTSYQDLIQSTQLMVDSTLVYFENYSTINKTLKRRRTIVKVTPNTTFKCASEYVDRYKRVAVLNFANPYHPGGGVEQGNMAQEECLCRSSNLYAALTCKYILTNYYDRNSRNRTPFGTDSVIYSKGVTVFKSDDAVPQKLDKTFKVDVITCAAPYYNSTYGPYNPNQYKPAFYSRIKNILEVAISNDVDVLILGAFGCGAFNNSPEVVASVFGRLLFTEGYSHYFRRVVFAIKPDENNDNYEVFKEILDTGHRDVED